MKIDLYNIAHTLKDKLPFIWDAIEKVNEWLFVLRYGKKVKSIVVNCVPEGYELVALKDVETTQIVRFFEHQPADAYTFFKPHAFDAKSIDRLKNNHAFLGYVLISKENSGIVAYGFNRCFCSGKAFRGKMVDYNHQRKGLGKAMTLILTEIAYGIGLKLYATISPDNYASLASAKAVNDIKIVRTLENGYYYIECTPKKTSGGANLYNIWP